MAELILPIVLSLLAAITAVCSAHFELRKRTDDGKTLLTAAGRIVILCHVITFALATSLVVSRVHQQHVERKRQEVVDQWSLIPITNLSISYTISPVYPHDDSFTATARENSLFMSFDFKEPVLLPGSDWYSASRPPGPLETIRISIQKLFPSFPGTVRDLIGHSINIRDDDLRPATVVTAIHFYPNLEAVHPFLTLSKVSHEYAGGYYRRVWYPESARGWPTQNEGHMNHRPFVVWPDVLPQSSPFERECVGMGMEWGTGWSGERP